MAHPNGGSGNIFNILHTFNRAYTFVGVNGVTFNSTTGEQIKAIQGLARDGITPVVVFMGERNRYGSVCSECWGFRIDRNKSRIGQCAEALDAIIKI
jgi:hypothetical protein